METQDNQELNPEQEPVHTPEPADTQLEEVISPEQEVPQAEQPEAPKKKKKYRSRRWLRRAVYSFGGVVLVCAIAVGSCLLTADVLERYYRNQMALLNQNTEEKLEAFRQELRQQKPQEPEPPVLAGEVYTPGQIFEANAPAVVSVMNQQMTEGSLKPVGTGTGFFISADGFLVTNFHVIDKAQKITVIDSTGRELPVKIIGADAANDLAVLKADVQDVPCVGIGSSDDLQVGDQVAAVGNALGQLHATMTVGYVSAKDRMVTTEGTSIPMLQTDAAINSGNSGGPLFNMKGQVVGITTAKISGFSASGASIEGIGYAIPIDDVIRQIRDLQKFGYLTGPYMGVVVQEMNPEVVKAYGLPVGLQIKEVTPGSAGEKAGLRVGDILLNMGGYDVTTVTELSRALRRFEAGDPVTLTVFRSGNTIRLSMVLGHRPKGNTPLPVPSEGDFEEWYRYFREYFGAN